MMDFNPPGGDDNFWHQAQLALEPDEEPGTWAGPGHSGGWMMLPELTEDELLDNAIMELLAPENLSRPAAMRQTRQLDKKQWARQVLGTGEPSQRDWSWATRAEVIEEVFEDISEDDLYWLNLKGLNLFG